MGNKSHTFYKKDLLDFLLLPLPLLSKMGTNERTNGTKMHSLLFLSDFIKCHSLRFIDLYRNEK